MNKLKLKTFIRLSPLYIILGVGIAGFSELLLYENPSYDDRITYYISISACLAVLIFVSIRILMGMGQKHVYAFIGKNKLGTNPERAYEIIENFLATSSKIHGVNYDEKYVLGWSGWYTTMMLREDILAVVIKKNVHRYKVFIPVMADYTLNFYLRDKTIQYISAGTKKSALAICETLNIKNVKYDNGWPD